METGDYLTTKDLISKAKTQEELDLISIITYKDQELSLLTEKYETQKHNAYFLLNQSNDWEEKYNKLKETFEELLDHGHNMWAIKQAKEESMTNWRVKAGLKEQ